VIFEKGAPSSGEEIGRVINWSEAKGCGWVERPCKDWLFVFSDRQEHIYGAIGIGNWVRFTVDRSKKRSGYVGTAARKMEAPKARGEKEI
jgi:hypothetical protein